MTKRRDILIALSALAALPAYSQQAAKVWRVGFLAQRSRPASIDGDFIGAFPRGMRELGYVEGKNLVIEWRFADSNLDRLPALAAELVRLKVDVLLAAATPATAAAQKATTTIPVVAVNVGDPVGSGFVTSLARPGANITGLTNMYTDINAKFLDILRHVVPRLSHVAVMLNPCNATQFNSLRSIQTAASNAKMPILKVEASNPQEIEAAFVSMAREKVGAVIVLGDGLFVQQQRQIAELAAKYRLPAAAAKREQVEAGFLLGYGPNDADLFRRAASYVDRIFKGAKPSDLPVEQPTKFEMFINRKTATQLGLKIPQSLILQADEVLE